jgi:steroid 5-alpha reductase family enzyme
MNHWLWVAAVIEAMAALAWIASTRTGQTKITFLFGFNVMLPVALLHLARQDLFDWRAILTFVSVLVYLLDMNIVILLWTGDTAMAKLDRHLGVFAKHLLPVIMTNAAGWLYCLPFAFVAGREGPLGGWDVAAMVVYVAGTMIHVGADWQKRRFKAGPENRGRVLDRGLWRYSRHPNYFGDSLVYIGWALFAANPWAWLAPATNLLQYFFDAMPKNEAWAADRYGAAWSDYASRTSRFVPWVNRGAATP